MADACSELAFELIEDLTEEAEASIREASDIGKAGSEWNARHNQHLCAVTLKLVDWLRRGRMEDLRAYDAVGEKLRAKGIRIPARGTVETAAARLLLGPDLPRERYCRAAGAARFIHANSGNRDPRDFLPEHGGVTGCYRAKLGIAAVAAKGDEASAPLPSERKPLMPEGLGEWIARSGVERIRMEVTVNSRREVTCVAAAKGPGFALVALPRGEARAHSVLALLDTARVADVGGESWACGAEQRAPRAGPRRRRQADDPLLRRDSGGAECLRPLSCRQRSASWVMP
jgi:hypothetical protein